ncbi:c-type cytochrome [uncultured Nitrospira sp.]|uniref:c-type cytochrome n=1 Tax=uncultured Nitrospira sp. TaxID=157176 RepID=UPI00313FE133
MFVHFLRLMVLAVIVIVAGSGGIGAQEKDPLIPRVPVDQRAEMKKLISPLSVTKDIIAEGKILYEGQGTCLNCHGKSGKGDGPIGAVLNPGPRNLTNCDFQKERSDGELFWIIKNGSPGTAMIPLVPGALNEEEAWKVIAYVRSFCP